MPRYHIANIFIPGRRCGLDARHRASVAVVAALLLFFLAGPRLSIAAESSLAVVDAGIGRSEDAPFVSPEYGFQAGDYLYFRFQISGFAIKTVESPVVRNIALQYEITPLDSQNVALTPPVSGSIETELNPEDKNWTPKRRVSFLLPSYVARGAYHLHVLVKDLIGHSEVERDFPFRMGGVTIAPAPFINVQNFLFFRKEDDHDSLDVPAYSPGDTVFARFDMSGYQLAAGNTYRLAYGVVVLRPDGKPYLQQPSAAELSAGSFYPAAFVPGTLNVTTDRSSARGVYTIVLTVRDLVSARTFELKRAFSLEQ
jgi:hypothetical protein